MNFVAQLRLGEVEQASRGGHLDRKYSGKLLCTAQHQLNTINRIIDRQMEHCKVNATYILLAFVVSNEKMFFLQGNGDWEWQIRSDSICEEFLIFFAVLIIVKFIITNSIFIYKQYLNYVNSWGINVYSGLMRCCRHLEEAVKGLGNEVGSVVVPLQGFQDLALVSQASNHYTEFILLGWRSGYEYSRVLRIRIRWFLACRSRYFFHRFRILPLKTYICKKIIWEDV